jgi:hypothetical protein
VPGRAADPVAQAKTGVAEAERTLAAFEAERAELVSRRDADVERRRQIAFAAHSGQDREARKRLDALHDEAVRYDSRLASLDDAINEAKRRVVRAHEAAAHAADRAQALQLREALIAFIATAGQLDEALAAVAVHGNKLCELQREMRLAGAVVPNGAQLDSLGARCLLTACSATPWRRHFETLAPHERRSFAELCAYWGKTLERNIATRLGEAEPATKIEPEVAA